MVREVRALQDDRVPASRGTRGGSGFGPRRRRDAARASRGGCTGSHVRGHGRRPGLSPVRGAAALSFVFLLVSASPSGAAVTPPDLKYRIEVTLDPLRHRLSGHETITHRSGADA